MGSKLTYIGPTSYTEPARLPGRRVCSPALEQAFICLVLSVRKVMLPQVWHDVLGAGPERAEPRAAAAAAAHGHPPARRHPRPGAGPLRPGALRLPRPATLGCLSCRPQGLLSSAMHSATPKSSTPEAHVVPSSACMHMTAAKPRSVCKSCVGNRRSTCIDNKA